MSLFQEDGCDGCVSNVQQHLKLEFETYIPFNYHHKLTPNLDLATDIELNVEHLGPAIELSE